MQVNRSIISTIIQRTFLSSEPKAFFSSTQKNSTPWTLRKLALVSTLAFNLGFISIAEAGVDLRILPLGDSITWGWSSAEAGGYNGYRGFLFNLLKNDSMVNPPSLNFVGSVFSGYMCDSFNEGHPGWVISQIADAQHAGASNARPNLLLLHAGTNDVLKNIDLANAPARLGNLIDQAFLDNPNATIIVAKIIRTTYPGSYESQVEAYNAAIPAVVQSRINQGKRIVLVDMWSALTDADLSDTIHPTDAGYQKMAAVWKQGIDQAISNGWISAPAVSDGGCVVSNPLPTKNWIDQGIVATGIGAPGSKIHLADFNGDHKLDYIYVHDDSSVEVWLNNGGDGRGGWNYIGLVARGVGVSGSKIRFADFNGDGKVDYYSVRDDSSVDIWLNNGGDGRGGWSYVGRAPSVGANGSQIRFPDIDGDGKADYVYLHDDGSAQGWLNRGVRWDYVGTIAGGVGIPATQVQFAKLFGTSKSDYVTVASNSSAKLWVNVGLADNNVSTRWQDKGTVAAGVGVSGSDIRFADFNGDGRDDYIYVDSFTGALKVWLNTP
jgi:lysophospholipase L1-like esterase